MKSNQPISIFGTFASTNDRAVALLGKVRLIWFLPALTKVLLLVAEKNTLSLLRRLARFSYLPYLVAFFTIRYAVDRSKILLNILLLLI